MRSLILFLVAIIMAHEPVFGQYPIGGALIEKPDSTEDDVELLSGGPPTPPPSSFSLKQATIKPGNQGTKQYSCVGWAVSYALLTYNKQQEWKWGYYTMPGILDETHIYSPAFLYNFFKAGTGCTQGINMYTALEQIKGGNGIGVPDIKYFPYDSNSCNRKPTGQDYLRGGARIIDINKIYHGVDPQKSPKPHVNTEAIQREIASGKPVLMSISPDKGFQKAFNGNWSPKGQEYVWSELSEPQPNPTEFHAVICIGYKNDRYEIMNSWGEKWGNSGYAWITEEMMQKVVWQAYSVENYPEGIALASVGAEMPEERRFGLIGDVFSSMQIINNRHSDQSGFQVACRYISAQKSYAIVSIAKKSRPDHILSTFIAKPGEVKRLRIEDKRLDLYFESIGRGGISGEPQLQFEMNVSPADSKQ